MKIFLLALGLLLFGCDKFDSRNYEWHQKYPKFDQINLAIVEDPAKSCSMEAEAFACTVLRPGQCTIYFPKEIDLLPAEVLKHELMHCRGWSHTP